MTHEILSPRWVWLYDGELGSRGVKELRGESATEYIASLPVVPLPSTKAGKKKGGVQQ
jgi:hypothetical protein